MRKEFVQRYQLISKVSPSLLQDIFKYITGDASSASCAITKAVQERLRLGLDSEDPDLMFDHRHVNEGRHAKYDAFWQAAKALFEEQAMTAVDSRRHGQVCHMAVSLSTHDFVEQVAKRLPPGADTPSESWVRYQFCPKNRSLLE